MHTSDYVLPKVIVLLRVKKLLNGIPRLKSESSDPKFSAFPASGTANVAGKRVTLFPNRNYELGIILVSEYSHFYITRSNLSHTTCKIKKAPIHSV